MPDKVPKISRLALIVLPPELCAGEDTLVLEMLNRIRGEYIIVTVILCHDSDAILCSSSFPSIASSEPIPWMGPVSVPLC